jgi:hypothetical protein
MTQPAARTVNKHITLPTTKSGVISKFRLLPYSAPWHFGLPSQAFQENWRLEVGAARLAPIIHSLAGFGR